MSVPCPHCRHPITPPDPFAGRHRIPCPQCARPVTVDVPRTPGRAWSAIPSSAVGSQGKTIILRAAHPGVVALDAGPQLSDTPMPGSSRHGRSTPVDSVAGSGGVPTIGLPPTEIPGYQIERPIGHGGMGTVYLARQLTLDRPVALKVMSRKWADDPVFAARFTREAYAAALLNHPNVVQIYDIGAAGGTRFISMEFVQGRTLAELVRGEGKIDPETAVGYILQAARGLKHAHDRGMIHRDVKPDNLLLTDDGVVKVADLGLVKTPGCEIDAKPDSDHGLHTLPPDMTGHKTALGTPAYMAPEQCRDASAVDHRADIYSLGCTLYALITGKQPFDGHSAVELMSKHAYEALVPPEAIVNRVPKELSAVVQRMMAKEPDARFADMGEVVKTLESWLGVQHSGAFAPREDQIEQVERCVKAFETAPAAVLRKRVFGGFLSACALVTVMLTFFGKLGWGFGLAGMVLQTCLAYFALHGWTRKTYLFNRVRSYALGLTVGDWAVAAAGVGLFAVFLWTLSLLTIWVGFGLIGVAAAGAAVMLLDRKVDRAREEPLAEVAGLLRRMRRRGVAEEDLRQFVAKAAGRNWEEFFEAVFGFEAKLAARAVLLRGGSAGVREKFAPWREPLVYLIDRAEVGRKETRERAVLERVERERVHAAGVTGAAAEARAAAAANALIEQANAIRFAEAHRRDAGIVGSAADLPPDVRRLLESAGQEQLVATAETTPPPWAVRILVGPALRAGLAVVMLVAFRLWAAQNHLLESPWSGTVRGPVEALIIDGVPEWVTTWCDTANVGWAAVLLLASLFYRGERMALMVLFGAAVVVLGHKLGIRTVEPFRDYHVSLMLGSAFALLGYHRGRPR